MGVFANDLSDKGYYPKTYKELTKLHIWKQSSHELGRRYE